MYGAAPTGWKFRSSIVGLSRETARPPSLFSFFNYRAWARPAVAYPLAPECAERWGTLMAAAQGGDSAAYEELLTEIAHWVRTLGSDHHRREISEDTVRAVLLRVHKARVTYHRRHPFGPWISAVVGYSLRHPMPFAASLWKKKPKALVKSGNETDGC